MSMCACSLSVSVSLALEIRLMSFFEWEAALPTIREVAHWVLHLRSALGDSPCPDCVCRCPTVPACPSVTCGNLSCSGGAGGSSWFTWLVVVLVAAACGWVAGRSQHLRTSVNRAIELTGNRGVEPRVTEGGAIGGPVSPSSRRK